MAEQHPHEPSSSYVVVHEVRQNESAANRFRFYLIGALTELMVRPTFREDAICLGTGDTVNSAIDDLHRVAPTGLDLCATPVVSTTGSRYRVMEDMVCQRIGSTR